MKKNLLYLIWLPLAAFATLFNACGSGNPEGEMETDTTSVEILIDEDEDEYSFIPPSPLQIASIFKRSGLQFASDITNSVDNASNYSSSLKRQLNFGIYSADLSYCVLNNQSKDALNYMKVIKQLSDEMGMSSIFNTEGLFESFEANIGIEDSMINILATVQEGMDDYLEDTEQQYMSAVFFAGGWIEGMYIGSKVANSEEGNIARRLVEQMSILESLIEGLNHHPNQSEELGELKDDLKSVKEIYDNFAAIKGQDTQDEDFSFEDVTISEEEISTLRNRITEIRSKLVNV